MIVLRMYVQLCMDDMDVYVSCVYESTDYIGLDSVFS